MHFDRIRIQALRNLTSIMLSDLAPLNIIHGANGSGKSSLIEALHLLSSGRSFRTVNPRHYIQHDSRETVIFAESSSHRIGLQKSTEQSLLRLDGNTVTQSDIARLLPVQLINPENMDLLDSGSKPRRQLLDWLMFHVEREFYPQWLRYQRALKQRNSLLKMAHSHHTLLVWEQEMAQSGELIHGLRQAVLTRWQQVFNEVIAEILPDQEISLGYTPGYDVETGLAQTLLDSRERDAERGHSLHGIHRADLRFKTPFGAAEQLLSRGQKKMLIIALKLSQMRLLHAEGHASVVLLDDMTAELDAAAQARLVQFLVALDCQIFLTTVDLPAVLAALREVAVDQAIYHLDQGQLQHD